MTTKDAINILERMKEGYEPFQENKEMVIDMAIAALKKQIKVKPIRIDTGLDFDGNWAKICPTCRAVLIRRITTDDYSYPEIFNLSGRCICGQALDWE